MAPLRIVLVMIEPPLPFGNAAARWYYVLLRGLVARGHRVTAFAACSKPGEIRSCKRCGGTGNACRSSFLQSFTFSGQAFDIA